MNGVLATLRGNKLALYGAAGFAGGAVGAVIAEPFGMRHISTTATGAIATSAISFGVVATFVAAALLAAAEWHQRRELTPQKFIQTMLFGALAGATGGAAGQVMYNLAEPSFFKFYGLRIAAWALAGLLLGAILSRRVPNLGLARAAAAGAIGGAVGCVGALITWEVLPYEAEFVGRIIGYGLLGLALGLAMHIVENLVREASVEVEWAPNETTQVSLGPTPVTVGGGEDHIFIRGLPHHVSSIVLNNGQIEHIETTNGNRTPLQDGSRLRIGGIYMVVHASK